MIISETETKAEIQIKDEIKKHLKINIKKDIGFGLCSEVRVQLLWDNELIDESSYKITPF